MVAALVQLERSPGPAELKAVLDSLLNWLTGPERAEMRSSYATFLRAVLLPARMPGIPVPEILDLEEVRSMLAERVVEWTERWKREGFQEGLEKGLQKGVKRGLQQGIAQGAENERKKSLATARSTLQGHLEKRFGPLPEAALARLEAIDNLEDLIVLTLKVPAAPSLTALGLA
jgi:flagellar biosynthesis/type III secretory pathway protein FliH